MKAPTKVGAFSFVYPLLISILTAEFVICQPAKGQRFEPVNFRHKDIPKGMSFFISLKQSVKFFRRSCGADAGGEIDPFPRGGDFRPGRAGAFFAAFGGGGVRTLRRAGKGCCRAAAGDAPLPGRGAKGGTGHPDLRPGFLYPLLRLPLTFRPAAQRSFAAKARGPQLRPLYHL